MTDIGPFRPGDNVVYLLDRTHVTDADLELTGNSELIRMAKEWLAEYPARFFVTVAHNFQPVPATQLNTFDSHEQAVLFPDRAALSASMPALAGTTPNAVWVIFAPEEIRAEVTASITYKAH